MCVVKSWRAGRATLVWTTKALQMAHESTSQRIAGLVIENHSFLLLLLQQERVIRDGEDKGTSVRHALVMDGQTSKEGCPDLSVSSGCPYCVSDGVGLGLARMLCLSPRFRCDVYLLLSRT